MSGGASKHADVTTERLHLTALTADDAAALFDLHADPRVWAHLPSGRHTEVAQTQAFVDRHVAGWARNGLAMWLVRDLAGRLVGVGGCDLRHDAFWNVGYRLAPEAWGHGYAQEVVTAGRAAATALRPDLPHVAYLHEHNERSRRAAERAGLHLVWRGPDHGNPDPAAVRLVLADRDLDDVALHAATENP